MNHHMHLEAKDNDRCYMFTLYCIRYKTFPAQMQNGGENRGGWEKEVHISCVLAELLVRLLAGWLASSVCVCICSQPFSDQARL